MVVNKIVAKLLEIGFTEYEAKAYIALLAEFPSTAYEIAKGSGIPTSKIYQVMDKLLMKGLVLVTEEGKKKRFVPIEPDEFLSSRKAYIGSVFDELSEDLAEMKHTASASYVWNIRDYRLFLDKARKTIFESQQTILISLWPEEADYLSPVLADARNRGVRCAAVQFGESELEATASYLHPIEDTLYTEKGGRGFVLIADSSEAVMGTILPDGTVEGTWSRSQGFIALAEDYVKHDVYIMKIVQRYDHDLIARFGPKYERLRDVFSDTEVGK